MVFMGTWDFNIFVCFTLMCVCVLLISNGQENEAKPLVARAIRIFSCVEANCAWPARL